MKTTNKITLLLSSILAGFSIGLGAIFNLASPNPYIGAILFSIGIYLVMIFGIKLYTGFIPKISYENQLKNNLICIPICLCGNIIGTEFLALAMQNTQYQNMIDKATQIAQNKNDLFVAIFGGIICGIIIGLIVLNNHKILRWILPVPLIALFILTKMEHVVADAFYMGLSNLWNIPFLLCAAIGNTIGGIVVGKIIKSIQ